MSNFSFFSRYTGILCLACATDHVQVGDTCEHCPTGAPFEAALVPLVVLCVLLYFFVVLVLLRSIKSVGAGKNENLLQRTKRLKKVNKMFGQGKILMSLVQIVASMPFVLTGVSFSPFFKTMASVFGIFNLDILALSSAFGCQYAVRFFDQFIIHLMLPVCCLLAIGAAVLTVRACVSKTNAKEQQIKINQAVSKIIVMVVLLIFPGLSTRLFSMFKCTSFRGIEDEVLLVADYSVQCHQGEHAAFTIVAILFLVVYIVGIPFIMFMLLWRNKKHLHDVDSKKHLAVKNALGGLYLQYEPKYWWFELVILLNKTIMCGGLVILSPGSPSQVLCGVLFMMFHLLVVLKLSPFEHDSEDVSSVAASLGLTLIYIGALMKMLEDVYKTLNGAEQDDRVNMSYIGVALDMLPLVCVGVVVGIVVVMDCGVYACCCEKKKGKGKGKGKKEKRGGETENHQVKEIQLSGVGGSSAVVGQCKKSSGAKKTTILPAPMVGGGACAGELLEEEEPGTGKRRSRGVTKKAKTEVVEL